MPDPRLIEAMEEVKAVLRKYDIAGIIHLASKTHTEFLYELSTTWTRIKITPAGEVRVRIKLEDFPNEAARNEVITHTIGTLLGFHDALEHAKAAMEQIGFMVARTQGEVQHTSRLDPPRTPPSTHDSSDIGEAE